MWSWLYNEGLLLTARVGEVVNTVLARVPSGDTAANHSYTLCGGELPPGIKITNNKLTGTFNTNVYTQVDYSFTIRHLQHDTGQIDDRTFTIRIFPTSTEYTGEPYNITIIALSWVNERVLPNYFASTTRSIITSGTLPTGLYLTDDGYIRGYAKQVDALTNYRCTVTFLTEQNIDVPRELNINVTKKVNPTPVLLNNAPLQLVPTEFAHHYIPVGTTTFTTFKPNTAIALKLFGHDFNNRAIVYEVTGLPSTLTCDPETGWITGSYDTTLREIYELDFSVRVKVKPATPSTTPISDVYNFTISFVNLVNNNITWVTPEQLGNIPNGSPCMLKIAATCDDEPVNYRLTSSSRLPPGLFISRETGDIIGTVMFQPAINNRPRDHVAPYTFEVEAYLKYFPYVISKKQFTFNIETKHVGPYESAYYPLHLQRSDRQILNTLLTDGSIIQDKWVYRLDDDNFGKATKVQVYAAYGLRSSQQTEYADIVNSGGFYNKYITFGDFKTAVATDNNGDVIYEVIYVPIIETNPNTTTVSFKVSVVTSTKQVTQVNNSDTRINTSTINVAQRPETIRGGQTNSLLSMQTRLQTGIGLIKSRDVTPLWMQTQQLDGSYVGFVHCWVVCYTRPFQSDTVLNSIKQNWRYNITDIGAEINSLIVNKSATYNWNTTVNPPQWDYLPSEVVTGSDRNKYDDIIPFPKTNIIGNMEI